jgi:Cu+-exporting ATPase
MPKATESPQAPGGEESPTGERREKLQLGIGGMSCSFCTSTIQKAYRRVPGVDDIAVSLSHQEGLITYDPERVTPTQLKDTLRDIGYSVRDTDKLVRFQEEEAELRKARNAFLVGAAFSTVIFVLMGVMVATTVMWPLLPFVVAAIAFVTVFVVGWHILKQAWTSLRNRILNQHVLLEFGALGGLVGGVGAMISPETFTLYEIFGPMTGVAEFFGAATLVTSYHLLSGYVSLRLRTRTSQAVRQLLELQPDTARVVRDGEEVEIPTAEVQAGELVRIRPGESIPVDGVVREGHSTVDEALVTGESIPEEKVAGDEVVGGSINQSGTLLVEVTRVGEESFLNQVARNVEEARALKPGLLQLVDRILQVYVPAVLSIAGLAFLFWSLGSWVLFGEAQWARALFAALAVGVMGYPCALGMATPLAMIRGGGMAAERGILMRSGEAFQVFGELSYMVLDKTGTITEGKPKVVDIVAPGDADELLRLAAATEASSEHPLARAVVQAARDRGLQLPAAQDFTSHTGSGVEAQVGGRRVLVAKPSFVGDQGVDLGPLRERLEALESEGKTTVGVTADGRLLGLVAIADTIKPDAAEAIARLKDLGMTPVMLTGDNERTARAVAAQVGIEEVRAQVLPDEKAARVRELQGDGTRVGMVGDGINDAPALMQADVGIAIGAGTDIAIESSDVVIMGDRLAAVPDTYEISTNSYRKTKQNLALAFVFNGIGVPAAATGVVSPVFAMLAMVASVTGVLTNSFAGRLLSGKRVSSGRKQVSQQLLEQRRRRAEPEDGHAHEPEDGHAHEPADERLAEAETAGSAPSTPGAQVVVSVPDIHCESCAARIQEGLSHTEGLLHATVDVDAKTVRLRLDPERLTVEAAQERLRDLGYEPAGVTDR